MNLKRLRYFVEVAEQLHFRRAAERLHMAQPPLSQQIRRLEDELGVRLLSRTQRRVELTNAGRLLLPEARAVLAAASRAEAVMAAFSTGAQGSLRLGFVGSVAYDFLPRFLRRFRKEWLHVSLELAEMTAEDQHSALRARQIDAAINRTPVHSTEWQTCTLFEEPFLLAVPHTHPMARLKRASLAALTDEVVIGVNRQRSRLFHDALAAMFMRVDVLYEPHIEVGEYSSALGLVSAGMGVSIVPDQVRRFEHPDLRYVRIAEPFARSSVVMITRVDDPTPVIRHALELARAVASSNP